MSLFKFEQDFAQSLRCIPISVRYKLDLSGVKLKLHQWMALTTDQRQVLVEMPCQSSVESAEYRQHLISLLREYCQEEAKLFEPDPAPLWESVDRIPDPVLSQANERQIEIPLEFWHSLPPLQRFALTKLSQSGHENRNFLPALQEFGWASALPTA
ncbi:MAG: nitrate reductase maturation protein NarM [Synechococcaceae cyanobacterium RM1_1_27]|nr:nitrate reductase maturation protein NarM [Synechococcaceae cyanobacterium SM2_3_2]NJO85868.1 nitrate reductase maturation protein NarM [Synechococcaceae cyanobacterium RM1_1_27]